MTKLTKSIQNCGLHDCNHNCFAITEKEALAAIEVMREAFIEAVKNVPKAETYGTHSIHNWIDKSKAIKAIKSVK